MQGLHFSQCNYTSHVSINWFVFHFHFYRASARIPNLTPLFPHFKVTGTDTVRSAIYDSLSTFHSNHGLMSYRFRKTAISVENRKFLLPPVHLTLALKGFPLELGTSA